jgi:hypothetical protein
MENILDNFTNILGQLKGEITLLRNILEDLLNNIQKKNNFDEYNQSLIDDDSKPENTKNLTKENTQETNIKYYSRCRYFKNIEILKM